MWAISVYWDVHSPYNLAERLLLLHTVYIVYVTIEETTIYPTPEQAIQCLIICQMLSNLYRDIHLFRFDEQTGDVFILAGTGDELEIIVAPNGLWRLLDETEF